MNSGNSWDAVIIGGGFFGLSVALLLKERGLSVVVLEREKEPMLRASYNNQARVHGGYHYPRSLMTAKPSASAASRAHGTRALFTSMAVMARATATPAAPPPASRGGSVGSAK